MFGLSRRTIALLVAAGFSVGAGWTTPCVRQASDRSELGALLAVFKSTDGADGDYFGDSVAASGSTVVVGAYAPTTSGAVYVFSETADGWRQSAELLGTDMVKDHIGRYFGLDVAISGSTIVANGEYPGRAELYKSGGSWRQSAGT